MVNIDILIFCDVTMMLLRSQSIYISKLSVLSGQWRSKEGQVGARALGRRSWGRINTLFAVI